MHYVDDELLGAGLEPHELLIETFRDETTVSVKLTHLETGITAIGTDSRLGASMMQPSVTRAAKLAAARLKGDLSDGQA